MPDVGHPIEGALLVDNGAICITHESIAPEDCSANSNYEPIKLPNFDLYRNRTEIVELSYRFKIHKEDIPQVTDDSVIALYIPRFTNSLRLKVGGTIVDDMFAAEFGLSRDDVHRWNWNRPVFYTVPTTLLFQEGQSNGTVQISIRGFPQQRTGLFSFYVGPPATLRPAYLKRLWLTQGTAQTALVVIIIAAVSIFVIWNLLKRPSQYLWLFFAWLSLIPTGLYFVLNEAIISYRFTTSIMMLAISAFGFCTHKYINRSLNVHLPHQEVLHTIYMTILIVLTVIIRDKNFLSIIALFQIGTVIWAFCMLTNIWRFRRHTYETSFIIIFILHAAIVALSLHDGIYFFIMPAPDSMYLLQLRPLIMALISISLVTSTLVNSLTKVESLNETLQARIDAKIVELSLSYADLAETRRRQAIDQERQRIMMDLHDGVGGHLVNTIAYIENSRIDDPKLKFALEDTLRDLGLMVDSLENTDSVSTLLGMFRSRVEPLLDQNNIVFNWKIGDEPVLPQRGPSQNLTLLRIVQEAVTNSIKHANATVITVCTDSQSVIISDNGCGLSTTVEHPNALRNGLGLKSMQVRAGKLFANFNVVSDRTGTTITLDWSNSTHGNDAILPSAGS